MSNKKCLIILINDYPYYDGEHFFEPEIKYLSKVFDKIILFSAYGRTNIEPTRSTEENVFVYPLSCNHNRLKCILHGLFSSNRTFNHLSIHGKKKIPSLYIKGKNYIIAKKCIKKLFENIESDFDYYIYSYWLTTGIAAIVIKKFLESKIQSNVRTISRGHGYDIYSELHPFNYQPFQKDVINLMDNVYPCSVFGAKYLSNKYPPLFNKIKTAYLFSEDHGCRDFVNNNPKIIVTVSGFRPVKRLPLFAKAFSKIAKSENVLWESFGDGEEFEEVLKIVKENNIQDKVVFHGMVDNKTIYDYYKNNNFYFYVNVSSSEGIPVSIMEAISFGIPVLATNVGGTSEIVDDSNGVLLNKDVSVIELANELKRIVNLNDDQYQKMRKNARLKWCKNFDSKANLDLWYKEIVGER